MILRFGDGRPFATGAAPALGEAGNQYDDNGKLWIAVRPLDAPEVTLAGQLDTGAPYCLLSSEWCEQLGLFKLEGEPASTRTANGMMHGKLVRTGFAIPADQGFELVVEATVLACEDWSGPNLLGLTGFLERLRFAVDPVGGRFFFGPCD